MLSIGVSTGLPALSQLGGGVPKGYVRLLVFDADSNLVSSQGQVQQLSSAAHTGYEPLTVQVIVQQDGYVTAYVGNESNADVYFDDVTIEHRQGLQVQENQYDPWGLGLAGINYQTSKLGQLNHFGFNSIEHNQDLGINVNTAFYRVLDYQLGRWWQVDPKYNYQESPYTAMANNPIRYSDPLGDIIQFSFKDGFLGLFGNKHTVQYNNGKLEENGATYTGKTSKYASKVLSALNHLSTGGAAGSQLVNSLQNRKETFTIAKNRPSGKPGNGYETTSSGDRTIAWKPGNAGIALNTDNTTSRPGYIGLGHELAHAYDDVQGTMDQSVWYLNSGGKPVSKAEIFSTHYENMLRAENGVVLRAFYGATTKTEDNVTSTVGGDGPLLLPGTRQSANVNQEVQEAPRFGLPSLFSVSKPYEYSQP